MKPMRISVVAGLALLAFATLAQAAGDKLKPFFLASQGVGDLMESTAAVKDKLTAAGFEVVGEYSPNADVNLVVVTSDALKAAAAKTEFGVYGAIQRVSVTKMGEQVQVAYTNPTYMAAAYRMDDDLAGVTAALAGALGQESAFGCEKDCKSAAELGKYHYMFGMPYFSDPHVLAKHASYAEAVAAVEQGLAEGRSGVSKVYRVDIPGHEATVFGVALKAPADGDKQQDDNFIMGEIDFKDIRSSAHLPYELVVVGDKTYALSAKFRIAINFPDLSMMGPHSFMNIMGAPDAIKKALTQVAGG